MTAKNMMRLIIDFITRSIVKYGFNSIDLHGAAGLEKSAGALLTLPLSECVCFRIRAEMR